MGSTREPTFAEVVAELRRQADPPPQPAPPAETVDPVADRVLVDPAGRVWHLCRRRKPLGAHPARELLLAADRVVLGYLPFGELEFDPPERPEQLWARISATYGIAEEEMELGGRSHVVHEFRDDDGARLAFVQQVYD